MAEGAKAPTTPAPTAGQEKKSKHPRWRGLGRFFKGVLYVIPGINLIPIGYDLLIGGGAYSKSRKDGNSRGDALIDAGYSGGAASGLGILSYLTRNPLLSWIPGIYYGLTGLKNMVAPKGVDNPARGEHNYVKDLGYPVPR